MGLVEMLRQDLRQALRDGDERRKSALRVALAAFQLAEVESKTPLTDADMVNVLRQEVRRREDALVLARQAGREDVVVNEVYELDVLLAYLPKLMPIEEVRSLLRAAIATVGATSVADLGKVMQVVMPQVKGVADGRMVNQVARELLADR